MPLTGVATPEHAIPEFAAGDRPNLHTSPGLTDIIGALDALLPPVGAILPYAGAGGGELPSGWLVCDGSAISRATYAKLFARIGTTFGAGDGSTTFNLPDLRGRTIAYKGTNAAVNALALNDGVAVANRRGPLHRHTLHAHAPLGTGLLDSEIAGTNFDLIGSGPNTLKYHATTATADGGSGISTDPLDGSAFLVLNSIIRT